MVKDTWDLDDDGIKNDTIPYFIHWYHERLNSLDDNIIKTIAWVIGQFFEISSLYITEIASFKTYIKQNLIPLAQGIENCRFKADADDPCRNNPKVTEIDFWNSKKALSCWEFTTTLECFYNGEQLCPLLECNWINQCVLPLLGCAECDDCYEEYTSFFEPDSTDIMLAEIGGDGPEPYNAGNRNGFLDWADGGWYYEVQDDQGNGEWKHGTGVLRTGDPFGVHESLLAGNIDGWIHDLYNYDINSQTNTRQHDEEQEDYWSIFGDWVEKIKEDWIPELEKFEAACRSCCPELEDENSEIHQDCLKLQGPVACNWRNCDSSESSTGWHGGQCVQFESCITPCEEAESCAWCHDNCYFCARQCCCVQYADQVPTMVFTLMNYANAIQQFRRQIKDFGIHLLNKLFSTINLAFYAWNDSSGEHLVGVWVSKFPMPRLRAYTHGAKKGVRLVHGRGDIYVVIGRLDGELPVELNDIAFNFETASGKKGLSLPWEVPEGVLWRMSDFPVLSFSKAHYTYKDDPPKLIYITQGEFFSIFDW